MATKIRVGDVFEIPLSGGRRGIGQYVLFDKQGPIVRVFNLIVDNDEEIDLDSIDRSDLMFPPVITGLKAAIRTGLWKKVGTLDASDFQYANFVNKFFESGKDLRTPWYLWDGEKSAVIGYSLPKEYQNLEFLVVWEPNNLARRIETGENPYSYENIA